MIFYYGDNSIRPFRLDIITEPRLKIRVLHNVSDDLRYENKNEIIEYDENNFEFFDYIFSPMSYITFITLDLSDYHKNKSMNKILNNYVSVKMPHPHVLKGVDIKQYRSNDGLIVPYEMVCEIVEILSNDEEFLEKVKLDLYELGQTMINYFGDYEMEKIHKEFEESRIELEKDFRKRRSFIFKIKEWVLNVCR